MAIVRAKELFTRPELPGQLAVIKGNFTGLASAITSLKERVPLVQSMAIIERVEDQLQMEPFKGKLKAVLEKNPDYVKIKNCAKILQGKSEEVGGMDPNMPFLFSYTPITSVDCKRTFLKLNMILSDQRTRLTDEHIRDILLLQWNRDLFQ